MTESEMEIVKQIVLRCIELCNETGNDIENGNGFDSFFKAAGNHPGPIAWLCAERIAKEFDVKDEFVWMPEMYQ